MSVVVIVEPILSQEPVLSRLRSEYIQALLAENEALRKNLAVTRAEVAAAWGYDLEPDPVIVEPVEVPSAEYVQAWDRFEFAAGRKLIKFFRS